MIGTRKSGSKYLKISNGFIVDNDDVKLGNKIGGYLRKIKIETLYKGTEKEIEIVIVDISYEDETYSLNMPSETTGRGFMLMLPNIDYTKVVEINTAKNDKGYSYIWATQTGKSIGNYWTKDNSRDKPEWVIKNGRYDKTAELNYLKNVTLRLARDIENYINPVFG